MKTTYLTDLGLTYGTTPPFDPDSAYPEIERAITTRRGDNRVYAAVRRMFRAAGLDAAHEGTADWNPLGGTIRPGQRVVVKPNWVFDVRGREHLRDQLTTHGAFLRVVLDYIVIALRGEGRITLCDCPLQSADFAGILADNRMADVVGAYAHLPGLTIRCLDLRRQMAVLDATMSKIVRLDRLPGDPLGYAEVDLGAESYLEDLCARDPDVRLVVGDYDEDVTNRNQKRGIHRYLIPNTVLDADVFVNVPKMKTHRKCGITGALKNLIGINAEKAYLAHYRKRTPRTPGDEARGHSRLTRAALFVDARIKPMTPEPIWKGMRSLWSGYKRRVHRRIAEGKPVNYGLVTSGGSWHGNDTLWRTIYDLNTIIRFADRGGRLTREPQRAYLAFVDGVVACEGDGPLHGTTRKAGTILLGDDPVATDACMAWRMGFEPARIATLSHAADIRPEHAFSRWDGAPHGTDAGTDAGASPELAPFAAPPGWVHHVERAPAAAAAGGSGAR